MLEKAQVWIHSKTDQGSSHVLLLKLIAPRGGFWQPVTGHIEANESIEAGALRETFEETALKPVSKLEPLNYDFTFQGKWGVAHETAFAMEVQAGCPDPSIDPNEHTAFQWLEIDQALSLLFHESNREALKLLARHLSVRHS